MQPSHPVPSAHKLTSQIIHLKLTTRLTNAMVARSLRCSASYVSKVWKTYNTSKPKSLEIDPQTPTSQQKISSQTHPIHSPSNSDQISIPKGSKKKNQPSKKNEKSKTAQKPKQPGSSSEYKKPLPVKKSHRASSAGRRKNIGSQPSFKQEEQNSSMHIFESVFRTPDRLKPSPARSKRRARSADERLQKVRKTIEALDQFVPTDPIGGQEEEIRSITSQKSPRRSQSQLSRVNGKIFLPSSTHPNIKILNGVSELPIFGSLSGVCKEQMEVVQTLTKTEMRRWPKYEKIRRHQHGTMNDWMRALLIDWLVQVHHKFECINYIDRVLESSHKIHRSFLEKICVSSLYLACKTDQEAAPDLGDLQQLTDNSVKINDILSAEAVLAQGLEFSLHPPTPYTFLMHYLAIVEELERVSQKEIEEKQRANQQKLKRFRARFKMPQPRELQQIKTSQAVQIFSSQSSHSQHCQFRRNIESRFGIKSLKDVKLWMIASYFLEIAALEPQFYYSLSPSQLAAIAMYGARRIRLREERYEIQKKNQKSEGSVTHCLLSQDVLSQSSSISSSQGTEQSTQFKKRRWPVVLEMLTTYSESVHLKPHLKRIYISANKHGDSLKGSFDKYSELYPHYAYLLPRPEKKLETVQGSSPPCYPSTPLNKIKVASERMHSTGATTVCSETRGGGKLMHESLKPRDLSSQLSDKKDPRLFLKHRGSKKKEVQKTLWNIEPKFATTRAAMIVNKGIQNAQRTQK